MRKDTDETPASDRLSPDEKRARLKEILQAKVAGRSELLSRGQRALWFMSRLAPESDAYNWVFRARITSEVSVPVLRATFQRLYERHEQLQSVVVTESGEPVRRTACRPEALFEFADAASWSEDELDARVREQIRRPFVLDQGPLVRVVLYTRGSREHILLIVAHHVVMDARSLEILLTDADHVYGRLSSGEEPRLSPLSSYAEYVNWQEEMLAGSRGEELRAFWLQQLSGELPVLDLPFDRPRPTARRFRGSSQHFSLSPRTVRSARELARGERTTLFVVMLAAFQAFLSRYSGQRDVLVGTPMAGRTHARFETIVGYFVNPVVIRADLSMDPAFRALCRQMRDRVLDAIAHQDYPFALLVEQLQPRRDPSHSPIFQAMIDWHVLRPRESGATPAKLGALELEPLVTPQQEGQFDLSLDVFEAGEALSYALKYDVELLEAETVSRMGRHFATFVRSALAAPDAPVSSLGLLDEEELRRVLIEWNDTGADYPRDRCVHQLFETQAAKTPDAVAVVNHDRRLSYAELDSRAASVAARLLERGVGADVPVGIYVHPSVEMLVGLLGILKAGAAYLPLDPGYPRDRLVHMIDDSSTRVLLTESALLDRLPKDSLDAICLDSLPPLASDRLVERRGDVPVRPQDLAYVIYTSGSTGKPKGVQVPHRCVVNLLESMKRRPGIRADDVLLAVTTISFDIHVLELFMPLASGACVVVVDPDVLQDGRRLLAEMKRTGATMMQATPSGWQRLIDSGWDEPLDLKILCGGEPMSPALAEKLLTRGRELWNMYGPTETTVWSSTHRISGEGARIPIGRPIDNTQFYVLDDGLKPVPIGVVGELYIGGEGVTRGYANLEELTRKRFIPDPFSTRAGARLYATGDRARYAPDGIVEVQGRRDHQVKLRGFRIELGEIESLLRAHDAVAEAIAVVRGSDPADMRLVAYLTPEGHPTPDASELRSFLREHLPDYMLPSDVVWLEEFPKGPSGKIDRMRLPAPSREIRTSESEFDPPTTAMERLLAEIWAELLEVDAIAVYDNFFELGGHSLLSMKVVDAFEKRTGRYMHPEELVNQTLKQVAARFDPDSPSYVPERSSWKQKLLRAATRLKPSESVE